MESQKKRRPRTSDGASGARPLDGPGAGPSSGPIGGPGEGDLPEVGFVAGGSLSDRLVADALRTAGIDLADDPSRPLLVVLPPATLGELHHPGWSSRLDGVPVSVPMVVVAAPRSPVAAVLADRVRAGRTSILDATTVSIDTIVSMLRLSADGRQVIDPPFAADPPSAATAMLSETERAVLELLAAGLSNRGIAARRFVAERTVETHVRQIFQKFGLADDPDLNRRVLAARRVLTGELGPW